MPVEFKDYYQVLGVAADASQAEIKKAFRNLARKHHPDTAKDKTASEIKFKEINEANQVLRDPEKRRKYDQLGANWNQPEQQAAPRGGGFRGGPAEGTEFHFEGTGFSDFFEQFFGSRGRSSGGFEQMWEHGPGTSSAAQHGRDIEGDILVSLEEVLHGAERTVRLQRVDPHSGSSTPETLRVKIPPGVREAQRIRLTGKGEEGLGGGKSGNLYLRVTFAEHPEFRVRGVNLYHDLDLAPWEAVLGATVQIPALDGIVALKIPPNTPTERKFRLRGKGLPVSDGKRGDLHAIVTIQVPSHLSPEEKVLWEQMADTSSFNPRKRP